MCGIAGVVYTDRDRPVDSVWLESLGQSIAHRGPDARGLWIGPGVGLVHQRLSIIDLEGGRQPLCNEDDSIQVIFNGEIYNYLELRSWLVRRGHRFRTNSDTEVLVHLYEEEQDALVRHLRGMFAFAIWDQPRRRLLLGRDRVGIKPLYYYRAADRILFASEPKVFLLDPAFCGEADPAAIADYLTYGVILGSRSIFCGVEKLLPAHTLGFTQGGPLECPRRYWQLRYEPQDLPLEIWQEALHDKLEETVRAHMVADVPVGAFLSGGIDSSTIVGFASRFTGKPLQTFTLGFHEPNFCERDYARKIAEWFGSNHTEEIVSPDAVQLLEQLTHHFDEPFADCSAIPTYLIARRASGQVKVVLSGDGGDESLAGYPRYVHDLREGNIRRWLPSWFRRYALRNLARIWPKADWMPRWMRWKNVLTNIALDPAEAYANTLSYCRDPLLDRLIGRDLRATLKDYDPAETIIRGYRIAPASDPLAGMLAADTHTILPDDYLVKVDRASMAVGIEVRPPLLDHEFLELTARIPSSLKIQAGETKSLLKNLLKNMVPGEIWSRPKKGFVIPLDDWFSGPLRGVFEDLVLRSDSPIAEFIEVSVAEQLLRAHTQGYARNGQILWSLLVLGYWSERYLGRSRSALQRGPCGAGVVRVTPKMVANQFR